MPVAPEDGLAAGRYFISEATHDRLTLETPAIIEAQAAMGLPRAETIRVLR